MKTIALVRSLRLAQFSDLTRAEGVIVRKQTAVRFTTAVLGAVLAVSCGGDSVNSPTTGDITQWVVDAITIPTSGSAATQLAFDLDGDGHPDNQLGQVFAALTAVGGSGFDLQAAMDGGIASGDIVQLISFQSDDATLVADAAAATHWYTGQATAGYTIGPHTIDANVVAGSFVGSLAARDYFSSNPVSTRTPAYVSVPVMLFAAAAPIHLRLNGAHVQWHFNSTTGIVSGQLQGSIKLDDMSNFFIPELAQALNAQIQADTASESAHAIEALFDLGGCAGATAGDHAINVCEVSSNQLLSSLLVPDVHIYDGAGAYKPAATGTRNAYSVGLGFTAVRTTF